MARQFKDVILFWANQRLASHPHHLNRFADYLENSWDGFKIDTTVHIIMTDPTLTEDAKEKAVITCVRGAVDRWLAKHAKTLEQAPLAVVPCTQLPTNGWKVNIPKAEDHIAGYLREILCEAHATNPAVPPRKSDVIEQLVKRAAMEPINDAKGYVYIALGEPDRISKAALGKRIDRMIGK